MATDSTYRLRFRLTLLIVALCAPLLIYGAFFSLQRMHTAPSTWIPSSFQEREHYEWFMQHFERELAVVVSWEGCTVDDPRLAQFERAVAEDDSAATVDHRKWFERVVTGYSVVRELESGALNGLRSKDSRRRAAVRRLQGALVGEDGLTSCAVVLLSDQGAEQRMQAVDRLRDLAVRTCKIPPGQLYISGPPAQSSAIDRESRMTLVTFTPWCIALALIVCCCCLRSLPYTLVVVTTAAVGQLLVLAVFYLSGVTMNAVLVVLPALVFVLTISAGIHLTNYYLDEVRKSGARAASVHRAMRIGWLPCVLAVGTTVIGLGSLLLSKIVPIWQFGAIASAGLVVAVCILFLVLPGALATWPASGRAPDAAPDSSATHTIGDRWWSALHTVIDRWWLLIAAGCLAGMVVAGLGLARVRTTADIRELMAPRSRSMRDMQWFEKNVGPLTPVEIILCFGDDCPFTLLDRIELVAHVDDGLRRNAGDSVRGTITALTFVPPISTPATVGRRSLIETRLEEENVLEKILKSPYVATTDKGQAWRISVRVPIADDRDYHKYLSELRQRVNALLDSKWERESNTALRDKWKTGLQSVTQIYTGAMPLADRAHRALLRDLFVSFLAAFGLVTVVLMLALRSLSAGLLSMLPTVLPTVLVFGTMGWSSTRVDVGSVMTASVALGIAVDDLLHFLAWFRRESQAGASRSEAVWRSLKHCGRAMVQTTLICGLGLIVFALSDFVPAQRFAWMMLILLFGALLADLVLLPAILISPLGACFVPRTRRTRRPHNADTAT